MTPRDYDNELLARISGLEDQVESLHQKVGQTNKGGGGIGCLGFILFVVVILELGEIHDIVTALG